MIVNQNSDKHIVFTAENAMEGMALERLRKAMHTTISNYYFVIGKDNAIVFTLPVIDLIRYTEKLR